MQRARMASILSIAKDNKPYWIPQDFNFKFPLVELTTSTHVPIAYIIGTIKYSPDLRAELLGNLFDKSDFVHA